MTNIEAGIKRPREDDEIDSPSPSKRVKTEEGSPRDDSDIKNDVSAPPIIEGTTEQSHNPGIEINIDSVPRSDDLWMDDGDIVLWVENSPDKSDAILFRLHRRVLAASGVNPFATADDWVIPRDGSPDALFVDGIPVVKYERQDPKEVTVMMQWIYTEPTVVKKEKISMQTISILLKRSIANHNPRMRRCALEYLWNMFPTSLRYHHCVPCFVERAYSPDPTLVYHPGLLYQALYIADVHRVVAILPLLYYYIAQWPIDWIERGLPREYMIYVMPEQERRGKRKSKFQIPYRHQLKIVLGKMSLADARHDQTFNFIDKFTTGSKLEHPTVGCPFADEDGPQTCFKWLLRVDNYLRTPKFLYKPNALEIMNTAQWEAFRKHLCKPCAKRVLKDLLSGRDKVWDKIPSFFGCKSWEEGLEIQMEIEAELFRLLTTLSTSTIIPLV